MPPGREGAMATKAREFIDFWIETSVHAREQHGGRAPNTTWRNWSGASFRLAKIRA